MEEGFIRQEGRLDYMQAMQIFTELWNEGVSLGVLPPKELLDGIEVDIRIAKALNSCFKNSSQK